VLKQNIMIFFFWAQIDARTSPVQTSNFRGNPGRPGHYGMYDIFDLFINYTFTKKFTIILRKKKNENIKQPMRNQQINNMKTSNIA
jgi:hypothetical protein